MLYILKFLLRLPLVLVLLIPVTFFILILIMLCPIIWSFNNKTSADMIDQITDLSMWWWDLLTTGSSSIAVP